MTVRTRLVLTFALVGGLLVLPALFAVHRLTELRDLAVQERGRQAEASLAVGRIEAGLVDLDRTVRSYLVTGEPDMRERLVRRVRNLESEVSKVREAGYGDPGRPLDRSVGAVADQTRRIGETAEAEGLAQATTLVPELEDRIEEARRDLESVAGAIATRAEADFERARSISAEARRTTVAAILIAVALTALLAAWTTRALTAPLRRLRTAVARVTEGHFEAPAHLPYDRDDEIGDLAASFRVMTRSLDELEQLRADFLGVASHELKTPINVIRGYAELVEEEITGELNDRQKDIMRRIGEQTRVLARQVSRLMDISRLESGRYRIEPESVEVEALLEELRRTYEILAHEKQITLTVEADEAAPERVTMDLDLVRGEVLGNLVSNALKFTPEGGEVSVRASGGQDELVVVVADSGPGIPPEQRERVFEKFFRDERSGSAGTGLGLAIARDVVEAHSGTIELLSDGGPGASFRVRLPTA